jgi:serine/threonine-protein kinase
MGCVRCCTEHPAAEACAAPAPKKQESLEGQRHGPLVLRRKLGSGSVGTVYLAEYPPTGHRFAIKALHPHHAD